MNDNNVIVEVRRYDYQQADLLALSQEMDYKSNIRSIVSGLLVIFVAF